MKVRQDRENYWLIFLERVHLVRFGMIPIRVEILSGSDFIDFEFDWVDIKWLICKSFC